MTAAWVARPTVIVKVFVKRPTPEKSVKVITTGYDPAVPAAGVPLIPKGLRVIARPVGSAEEVPPNKKPEGAL